MRNTGINQFLLSKWWCVSVDLFIIKSWHSSNKMILCDFGLDGAIHMFGFLTPHPILTSCVIKRKLPHLSVFPFTHISHCVRFWDCCEN